MEDGIWLVTPTGLTPMKRTPYQTEDAFQELLAKYPDLLGTDPASGSEGGWLLVTREMEVPDAADAAGRWFLDHLFLDREGIPTLVEVKRASDTRTRREVVAQMLDYAANGVAWWPPDEIRSRFEVRCVQEGLDPEERLNVFLGGGDPATFWTAVRTNLLAGRIRMVFVADEIPPELRRIVEFLNQQMDPAEVIAVELRQYVGQGDMKTLVPRVFGRTAVAEVRKGTTQSRQWDESSFLSAIDPSFHPLASRLITWASTRGSVRWGQGGRMGGFVVHTRVGERKVAMLSVYIYDRGPKVHIHLGDLGTAGVEPDLLVQMVAKLNAVPGVKIPPVGEKSLPSIPMSVLGVGDNFDQFAAAMETLGTALQPG